MAVVSVKKALEFWQKASLPSRGAAWIFSCREFKTALSVDLNAFHMQARLHMALLQKI
jgi:hypothetical protein